MVVQMYKIERNKIQIEYIQRIGEIETKQMEFEEEKKSQKQNKNHSHSKSIFT